MTSDQSVRTGPDDGTGDGTRDPIVPLSYAQERVWFFDQLEPGQAAYNLTFGLRLRGQLDIGALERSLAQIIARHESLRTTFPSTGGKAYQLIAPPAAAPAPLPVIEVTSEADLAANAAAESARPFDLSAGPLLRTRLFALAADEHVLLCVVHHIVADGWSIGLLLDELGALYSAFVAGRPSPLTELPIQYADYVLWQREVLQGDVLDVQLQYWRSELADCPPLALPTDRPRPREQTFNGDRHWFRLPRELGDEFLALVREQGATPFMGLLAAFQLVLARHSGQPDFAVGVPIAGRPRSELKDLIGFFVNTLILRTDLSGDPTFRDLLARTRAKAVAAYEHEDVPLQRVATELNYARDLSRNALFQAVFAWQDVPAREPTLPDLDVSFYSSDETVNLADLQFNCYPEPDGLLGHLIYNRDLFDAATVERLAGHFQNVLAGIVADPDRPLSQVSMLSAAEQAEQ
ncbi:MAG: condensation domain-containing protein, partial [Geodermatophilaceae bacterium]